MARVVGEINAHYRDGYWDAEFGKIVDIASYHEAIAEFKAQAVLDIEERFAGEGLKAVKVELDTMHVNIWKQNNDAYIGDTDVQVNVRAAVYFDLDGYEFLESGNIVRELIGYDEFIKIEDEVFRQFYMFGFNISLEDSEAGKHQIKHLNDEEQSKHERPGFSGMPHMKSRRKPKAGAKRKFVGKIIHTVLLENVWVDYQPTSEDLIADELSYLNNEVAEYNEEGYAEDYYEDEEDMDGAGLNEFLISDISVVWDYEDKKEIGDIEAVFTIKCESEDYESFARYLDRRVRTGRPYGPEAFEYESL